MPHSLGLCDNCVTMPAAAAREAATETEPQLEAIPLLMRNRVPGLDVASNDAEAYKLDVAQRPDEVRCVCVCVSRFRLLGLFSSSPPSILLPAPSNLLVPLRFSSFSPSIISSSLPSLPLTPNSPPPSNRMLVGCGSRTWMHIAPFLSRSSARLRCVG